MDKSLDEIIAARPRGIRRSSTRRGTGGRTQILGTGAASPTRARYAGAAPAPASGAPPADKIIVSNLPLDVNEVQVKELFHQTVGPLREVTLHYDAAGRSKGVAAVHFQRRGDASKAYQQYNNRLIDGTGKKRPQFGRPDEPDGQTGSASNVVTIRFGFGLFTLLSSHSHSPLPSARHSTYHPRRLMLMLTSALSSSWVYLILTILRHHPSTFHTIHYVFGTIPYIVISAYFLLTTPEHHWTSDTPTPALIIKYQRPMRIEIVVDPARPAPASLVSRVGGAPESVPRGGPSRGRGRGRGGRGGGRRNERPVKSAADLDAEMEDYTSSANAETTA
ncbi:hypothetical protein NEOLEDRAFT_1169922 [Neolentinus lepideus HHB14362 ss-1]|uniref:RRM domain-containing protein n=1 Tax=Neolentinus lepideus HHB14362 ss-1 TaxID=1314782 RepID=A0A165SB29_9AGAM|nr:hypothetical protein NEOLEDRAFT_1169922 [Neolentinus lepideus HHB14362 ss-1]